MMHESEFSIIKTPDEGIFKQIVQLTQTDTEVLNNTRDIERFADMENLRLWLSKSPDRQFFCFMDSNSNLASLIWFRKGNIDEEEYPHVTLDKRQQFDTTFAIRIYKDYRGKGLGKTFMNMVNSERGYDSVWLETHEENLPAVRLYRNVGFEIADKSTRESSKILMLHKG